MSISEARSNTYLVVKPTGRLESSTAPALDRHLTAVIQRGDTHLVIDLSGVDYISSTGLSIFLSAAKKVKAAGGVLALAGLNARVRLVFEMSGFLRLFPTYPTVEGAVAAGS